MIPFLDTIWGGSEEASPRIAAVERRRPEEVSKTDKKVLGSDAVRMRLEDLYSRNENYKVACGDALDTVYPLLHKMITALSKNNSEGNKEFTERIKEGLEKLDVVKGLIESTRVGETKEVSSIKSKKSESITQTHLILLKLFKRLSGLCDEKLLSSDLSIIESCSKNLDNYKTCFDDIVRDLQDPLNKMKDHLKSFRESIDFVRSHPIPENSISDISQYMIFLDKELVEQYNHEVKCQIEELSTIMGFDVKHHLQLIIKKLSEWEAKNDEYSGVLVQIESYCRAIEWKLHYFQYVKTLKPEIVALRKQISELGQGIEDQEKMLRRDREASLEGANKAVNQYIETYSKSTIPSIEAIHARVMNEMFIMKIYLKKNMPEACDSVFSDEHFYANDIEKSHREKVSASLGVTQKEVTTVLNELQVLWDEQFRPFNAQVVDKLNVLASSVLTKNGVMRGGILYSLKEVAGANTKRVPYPNYKSAEEK